MIHGSEAKYSNEGAKSIRRNLEAVERQKGCRPLPPDFGALCPKLCFLDFGTHAS